MSKSTRTKTLYLPNRALVAKGEDGIAEIIFREGTRSSEVLSCQRTIVWNATTHYMSLMAPCQKYPVDNANRPG